jgi:hypothetical protein
MQIDNNSLIEEMLFLTERATTAARRFKELPEGDLNFKNHPRQWSILECVEHLNRYGEFYLPAIEKAIMGKKTLPASTTFRSGVFGNYFAKLMQVKNGKMTKMKTPADKNPLGSQLTAVTIDRFLKQQEMLTSLLNQARHVDLTGTKVPISLTRWVRLRLGDTFRFFVYHIERHIMQAEKVLGNSSR